MAHCYYHALSSVRKWGGGSDDYLRCTNGSTSRKRSWQIPGTVRCGTMPRAFSCSKPFRGDDRQCRLAGWFRSVLSASSMCIEDLGHIPSFADWGRQIAPQAWMLEGRRLDEADGRPAVQSLRVRSGDWRFARSGCGPVGIAIDV